MSSVERTAKDETLPPAHPRPADLDATIRTDPPGANAPATPQLAADSYGALLRRQGLDPANESDGPRYEVESQLGQGSGGTVWAVNDRRLARPLAVKVLNHGGNRSHFVDEARITAELQHPNVLPVHDLDLTSDGDPCFMMKRVEGTTLGAALQADPRPAAVATVNGVVSVFIAVAQALAYAHSRGVIHQDVKPDNILLGAYGEVLLVDWGCAVRHEARGRRVVGTPLYMAPEQARREFSNASSDVYALGGSFFHALIRRPPTIPDDDIDVFWQRKQAGAINAPSVEERAAVPPALLAIALRALNADPPARYPGVEAMLNDLRAFQAGLAVSAHRESLARFLLRWYRHHRSECWIVAVALVLLAGAGGLWWREKLREASSWRLVMDEDFHDPAATAQRWKQLSLDFVWKRQEIPFGGDSGAVLVGDAMTIGHPAYTTDVVLRDPLCGSLAMEWDAVPLTGGNLNCFLGDDRVSGYTFHVAGFGDPAYAAMTRGIGTDVVGGALVAIAHLDPPIRKGQRYHFRLEREGSRLHLFIDGAAVFDVDCPLDPLASAPQAVGFDTYAGNRVLISGVRVWTRPLPERISPLTVASAMDASGLLAEARRQYRELANAYGDSDLGIEASFRGGLLAVQETPGPTAELALLSLVAAHPGHVLAPYILGELHAAAVTHGDDDIAERVRTALLAYPGHPARQRVLFDIGADHVPMVIPRPGPLGFPTVLPDGAFATISADVTLLETWAQRYGLPVTGNRLFESTTTALRFCGREDFIVTHWPAQNHDRGGALIESGHPEEALRDWGYLDGVRKGALEILGRNAELSAIDQDGLHRALVDTGDLAGLRRAFPHDERTAEFMIAAGKAAEILADPAFPREARAWALLSSGHPADALALVDHTRFLDSDLDTACLLALGREQDALANAWDPKVPYRVAIARWRRGDHQGALDLIAHMHSRPPNFFDEDQLKGWYLVPALMAVGVGDAAGARARVAAALAPTAHCDGLRFWHILAYACGHEDAAAFRAQPAQQGVVNRLKLAEALRADLAGEASARAAWNTWLAADPYLDERDFMRAIAQWRVAELTR